VNDKDNVFEAGSTSTQTTKVNNAKFEPNMIIKALEEYIKKRDNFLDKIFLKGEDF
jgi:hypothetical protein